MFQFKFDVAVVSPMVHALARGEPILPPPGGWDANAAIALMGVLRAVAFQLAVKPAETPIEQMGEKEQEERAELEATAHEDIKAAVEFLGMFIIPTIMSGEYADLCEPVLSGPMGAPWHEYLTRLTGFKKVDAARRALDYIAAQQPPSEN